MPGDRKRGKSVFAGVIKLSQVKNVLLSWQPISWDSPEATDRQKWGRSSLMAFKGSWWSFSFSLKRRRCLGKVTSSCSDPTRLPELLPPTKHHRGFHSSTSRLTFSLRVMSTLNQSIKSSWQNCLDSVITTSLWPCSTTTTLHSPSDSINSLHHTHVYIL